MVHYNIREELERFSWDRASWTSDKLIAASPFRYDRSPSFFVRLESDGIHPPGSWCDSGATDPSWGSGGIVKLLSFLRNESYEETREYLRAKYDNEWDGDSEKLTLSLSLPRVEAKMRDSLDSMVLDEYKWRSPYLASRGISEPVQRRMKIGYDKRSKAVTIPWFLPDGRLANVKYRRTDSKVFWYYKGGMPLRELVYGIDVIYKERLRSAVLVEGEIDAMYCMTAGWPAIAIGGAAFTEEKSELIKRSHIERLLIATDNDAVGENLRQAIQNKLCGSMELTNIRVPYGYKDVNDFKDTSKLDAHLRSQRDVLQVKLQIT